MTKLNEAFQDESGAYSSTRIVGIACGFTLIAMGMAQAFSPLVIEVSDRLVEALEYITISCLLWAQVGKFSKHTVNTTVEKVDPSDR
jgi:hypothetical protein